VTERAHLVVTGRVQGVWYRASMRREAEALGLAGWVCNRPDGSVEAEATGPAEAIDRLIAWARIGPPAAVVEDVRVVRAPAPAEPGRGFVVR
jgi:acylphosphatase